MISVGTLGRFCGDSLGRFQGCAKDMQRRQKGLIDNAQWRARRLRLSAPVAIAITSATGISDCPRMGGRAASPCSRAAARPARSSFGVRLILNSPRYAGALARFCARTQQTDQRHLPVAGTKLHVTIDQLDLPDHPERLRPVKAMPGRVVGIDLNPGTIGLTIVENAEIARRGLAARCKLKDVLPASDEGWLRGRWKESRAAC
ncbi:hypothetical protein [Pseudorhodoplanes sinuspersici]|nr:hypothetical protein [Pseudorhodoplanes sinuspersici]